MRINKGFNPPYRINLNGHFATCLAKFYSSTNSPPSSRVARNNTVNNQSNKPISKASWKIDVNSIYLEPENFNLENFSSLLKSRFVYNNTYSILVKVSIQNDEGYDIYFMLNEQFGVPYYKSVDVDSIFKKRFETLDDRLNYYLGYYNAIDINLIQIMYVMNNSFPKLRIKNINKIDLDKNIINIKQTKQNFSDSFLPLTTNEIHYGTKLSFESDSNTNLVSTLEVCGIDIISKIRDEYKIKDKNFTSFPTDTRFYHYEKKDKNYLIAVKDIDNNKTTKVVYNLHGSLILTVTDEILDNECFNRVINSAKFYFEKDEVKGKSLPVKLPLIKPKPTKYKGMANPNIGSFDIETFKDYDSNSKVYALGFTNTEKAKDKQVTIYYLGRDGNTSDEIIIKCIDDMLKPQNNNHIYYTHNLGGYDIVFILAALRRENTRKDCKHYIMNSKLRDNKILKTSISVKTPSGYSKITFIDSYNLLTDNLDNLSKSFGSETKKGLLPYTFIRSDTLNYVGNTPPIEYYKRKNKIITKSEYKSIFKTNWSLKDETIKYLEQDLLSLYEIMDTFNRYVFIEYNIQMTENLTISRLALNIFLKLYLGNTELPVINNKSVYSSIKQAYHGGIVEVYKPYGKKLFYYDVNSLYPFVANNPMPGAKCDYIESEKPLKLDDLFGFYYAKIKTTNDYLGLLPVHNKGLLMPNGEWFDWYFSEELKFVKDCGYEVEVYKGYSFNKVNNVFTKFVKDLFEKKSKTVGSEKLINKFLLNSLLGRFGMAIDKLITEIVSMDKYNQLLSTRPMNSTLPLSDEDMLVSYKNEISKTITTEHGLDYIDVLNHTNKDIEKLHSFDDVAISISAAVTSYARIYMTKIKRDILARGGNIYYSDTDSIVTDIELPNNLVGNDLGQFKLEYKIKEGYFISSKTYCLVPYANKSNKPIIKAKGVLDNSLSLANFKDMYFKKLNIKARKTESKSNPKEGYVNINEKDITLRFDSFSKRDKIYNRKGRWIDTKPITIKKEAK